jgi:hypothetical protein
MTRPHNASLATVTVAGWSYPPGHGGWLPYLLHPVPTASRGTRACRHARGTHRRGPAVRGWPQPPGTSAVIRRGHSPVHEPAVWCTRGPSHHAPWGRGFCGEPSRGPLGRSPRAVATQPRGAWRRGRWNPAFEMVSLLPLTLPRRRHGDPDLLRPVVPGAARLASDHMAPRPLPGALRTRDRHHLQRDRRAGLVQVPGRRLEARRAPATTCTDSCLALVPRFLLVDLNREPNFSGLLGACHHLTGIRQTGPAGAVDGNPDHPRPGQQTTVVPA